MGEETKGLDVTIMGREFRMACPENEQQALLASVEFLDRRMREIRDSGKVIGIERIAIMAALNIAHEYLNADNSVAFDASEIKRRIASIQARIEQAMSEQNELF
ncbi:MAG: cell division protein ZapA [Burkholderiales bacterium]